MIAEIPALPAPGWLTAATAPLGTLPLGTLLQESVYYPACGFDGDPIKFLAGNFHSFVYVDYGRDRAELLQQLGTFKGYRLLACRDVEKEEIIPTGFMPQNGYPRRVARWVRPWFATWAVFERLADFDDDYGPNLFSLLYVGGEGVLTFRALYHRQSAAPAVVAIIQPGHGFGGNWTNFEKRGGILAQTVLDSPFGTPDYLLYGGWGRGRSYGLPCWPEFDDCVRVLRGDGRLRLWRRPDGCGRRECTAGVVRMT